MALALIQLTIPFHEIVVKSSSVTYRILVSLMDNNIIDWLLEGPAWLKYAVELSLLELDPDVQPVVEDPTITGIVNRLKNNRSGIPAIPSMYMYSDEYQTPYWDLFFLADLGLTAAHLGLEKEIEDFLDTQSYKGTFITEPGMEPTYFCKSAIILSSIVKMGYSNDQRVKKLVQLFLSSQRLDGGWYCNPDHDIGSVLQHEPSCPQDNLNILLLLGQYPDFQSKPRFNGAIDLLLDHWEMRNTGFRIVYFGVGRRYKSLQYPATRYGILRVLDAISLFPYSLEKASFHNMLDFVHRKSVDGKYNVEIPTPYTDLEQVGAPSRLLTFLVRRIDKRVSSAI